MIFENRKTMEITVLKGMKKLLIILHDLQMFVERDSILNKFEKTIPDHDVRLCTLGICDEKLLFGKR